MVASHPTGALSPNQRSKQQQIIDAARVVLVRDGLAGCTARAVADASPLTKSAVHYYFHDIHEIIDRAVAAHLDDLLADLRDVAAQYPDPAERLWAVIQTYLATFTDKPHAAFLWFEYWVTVSRRHSTDTVAQMVDTLHDLLVTLVQDLAVDDVDQTARALQSWLLGTIVHQHLRPTTTDALRAEFTNVLAQPAPGHR